MIRAVRRASVRASLAVAAVLLLAAPPAGRAADARDASLPRADLLARAMAAYWRVADSGLVRNPLLTVIDYAIPSSQRRLWVIDPETRRVLRLEFVAHGRGSSSDADPDRAVRFGNDEGSRRSSLGTFLTGAVYAGDHGRSLELIGLDRGVNDHALERRIVMHPADYASETFRSRSGGRLGRSWGCPALDPAVAGDVIDRIEAGSVVYAGAL